MVSYMALLGSELLAKAKEMGDVSKSDLVRAAGFVSTKKDDSERLNFTVFSEVLLLPLPLLGQVTAHSRHRQQHTPSHRANHQPPATTVRNLNQHGEIHLRPAPDWGPGPRLPCPVGKRTPSTASQPFSRVVTADEQDVPESADPVTE